MALIQEHTRFIKETALSLGFTHCGIAKAAPLDEDARRLEKWLHAGMHGSMQYLENHFDLRVDPTKLVPGAKSVITLQKAGDIVGRGFVDSAPVLERTWAQKTGAGWIGKNGNLISKTDGSFFFIATIIVDLPLIYDDPFAKDYCGSCTKCIDACPTSAILPNKTVDGSKCISYFTIELKDAIIPSGMKGTFDNWMFGCDTCQDVCPWNRFSKQHQEPGFTPNTAIETFGAKEWSDLTKEGFKTVFKNSPLQRSKFEGITRNLQFIEAIPTTNQTSPS
ncbi:MAG: tRNA epoxyqueuosine(34) reductase QueG [Sediminibacterium sp.]|nr:tRNA epoxyqueuosine(34) reductase QueG [Sediminibacterium sp.]